MRVLLTGGAGFIGSHLADHLTAQDHDVVGHGLDPSDAPLYALNNDLGTAVLLAAMHEKSVKRLVMASSMVVYGEGRYEPPCPHCGNPLEPRLVPEDARWTPGAPTRPANSPRSTTRRRGPDRRAATCGR